MFKALVIVVAVVVILGLVFNLRERAGSGRKPGDAGAGRRRSIFSRLLPSILLSLLLTLILSLVLRRLR